MASLVLSVVYATDQRRNHRLYPRHLHLSGVRAGVPGLQRVGDPGVNAVLLGPGARLRDAGQVERRRRAVASNCDPLRASHSGRGACLNLREAGGILMDRVVDPLVTLRF
jgi:hypothetical protein